MTSSNILPSRRLLALKATLLGFAAVHPAMAQDAPGETAASADASERPAQLAYNTLAASDAAGGTQNAVEEITVTARYRRESASKVPIAISVIDGKAIDNQQITNISSATRVVPSLQIQGINPRNQTVAIRGLGANPGLTTEGFEAGVGLYIDGVYYARSATVLFDIFDIDRIEVLRGPQGTLFGKNTTAGALSVTTKAPEFDWGGSAQLRYGNYNLLQAQGTVTGPISDQLAIRLTFGDSRRDDTIKATNPNLISKGLHNQSARLQLLFNPTDTLSFRLIGDYNKQHFSGPHQVVSAALPRTLSDGSTIKNWFDRLADSGYVPPPGIGTDPKSRWSDINSQNYWDQKAYGASLQGEWTLPGGATLTSITALRRFELLPSYDSDYGGSEYYKSLYVHIKQRQFSQELRLSSRGDQTLDYTVGGYYYNFSSPVDSHSIFGSQAAQFNYGPTASPLILDGLDNNTQFTAYTKSYSLFGQLNWNVTDKLSLVGGLRYTHEKKHGDSTSAPAGTYAPISDLPADQQASAITRRNSVAPTRSYSAQWSGGELSGTLSLSYQWHGGLLTYATYSRGFQAAGLNLAGVPATTPKIVEPQTVNSYELGLKSSLFQNRLSLNVAAFWTDVNDFQATIYDSTLGGRNYIANAGSVRSRGVEFDARAVPVEGLSLSASLAYTDAEYTSLRSTPCPYLLSYQPSCDLTGGQLAGVSKWAGSIQAQYARNVSGNVELYVGGDWTGRSGFYSQLNLDPFSRVSGYGATGAHLGIRDADQRWDASLWVNNLFDKYYVNSYTPSRASGYITASIGDPRTFGFTVRGSF